MMRMYLGHIRSLEALFFFTPSLAIALQTQCPWDPTYTATLLRPSASCALPVDDTTVSSSKAWEAVPWIHPPFCVVPRSIESTEKFCVYSTPFFNEGGGLSLIATPETAASLSEAVKNPLPAWRSHHHLARQGRVQTEAYDLPYTVVSIPGKGWGVVATRHIYQFETIMTSFPVLISDNVFFPSEEDQGLAEGPEVFQRALDQLADKDRFLNLARSKGEDVHPVEDVVRTNAFGITVDGRAMKGLYPEIARLNHACDPNAYSRYTKRDLAMSAVATRDIEPGEEITISYISLGMPTAHRRKTLRNWGFNCSCDLCMAPAEAREASDRRRERLVEVYYGMQEESTSYDTLVTLTREFIQLAQVERLIAKVGEYYQAFMRIYYSFGDSKTAQKYGLAALKFAEVFSDPDGGFCTGLRKDLAQIEEALSRKI